MEGHNEDEVETPVCGDVLVFRQATIVESTEEEGYVQEKAFSTLDAM